MTYIIRLSDRAEANLQAIANPEVQNQIIARIDFLARNALAGKPLGKSLKGYRSLRAARSRYRIIYQVKRAEIVIIIVLIGLRKGRDFDDVYRTLERLKREGMLKWYYLTGCLSLSPILSLITGPEMRAYTAYVEFDPETELYIGVVPGIPGAHTQAASLDELQKNLKEVLELCLEEYSGATDYCAIA